MNNQTGYNLGHWSFQSVEPAQIFLNISKDVYRVYSGLTVPQLTSEGFLNPPEYFVWISEDYLDPITKTRKVNVHTAVLTTDL